MDQSEAKTNDQHQREATTPELLDRRLDFSSETRSELKKKQERTRLQNLIEAGKEDKAVIAKLHAENEELKAKLAALGAPGPPPTSATVLPDVSKPVQDVDMQYGGEHGSMTTTDMSVAAAPVVSTGSSRPAGSIAVKRKQSDAPSGSPGVPADSRVAAPVRGISAPSKRPKMTIETSPSVEDFFPAKATRTSSRQSGISFGTLAMPSSSGSTSASTQAPQAVSPYGEWNNGINPFVLPRVNHHPNFTGVFRGTGQWQETRVSAEEIAGHCRSCRITGHESKHCPSEMGVAPIVGGPHHGLFRSKPHAKHFVAEPRCTYDVMNRRVIEHE
ncbi:hypothetical protein P389DRAFT_208045 [Cystobasidium minutum MCA 4210]|uniref:uncharacterized protein n=1 Tax=Cystobasidium minutum MCA 4210 TaxID=1397322 RepID=UPI0034CFAC31|eukprot:jgi/Rhomi1/208045/estExt_Genemark1.C_1_t30044